MNTLQQHPFQPQPAPFAERKTGKYQIIYADPPWKYHDPVNVKPWMAEAHYPTMPTEDISSLKVNEIADENCALFLWATFPKIFEAQKVIEAWGFTYRTVAFVWVKASNPGFPRHWIQDPNRYPFPVHWGIGHWTKSNVEVCLLATKGNPERQSHGIHQLIYEPVGRHSQKPEIVRQRIVQLIGDKPRIELFARQKTQGWEVWGNEVTPDIALH